MSENESPMDVMIGVPQTDEADRETARRHLTTASEAETAGDHEACASALRAALGADPSNQEALFRLAYLLDLQGEEDEAVALYERCIHMTPAPVNALLNLAVLYEDRSDYAAAERCLRQILDTNPTHVRALLFMKDVLASRDMVVEEDDTRDILRRSAMLDIPVTDFELSVRARNCLKKMNIRSLGDLLRITESELLSYKNFGETSLLEIKQMLAAKGLRLGQLADDHHRHARHEVYESAKGSAAAVFLEKPINDLNLTIRARKAIQALNIRTIGDLCSRTEAELMGVKNFGSTSLVEIRERLGDLGLSLRQLEA